MDMISLLKNGSISTLIWKKLVLWSHLSFSGGKRVNFYTHMEKTSSFIEKTSLSPVSPLILGMENAGVSCGSHSRVENNEFLEQTVVL